MTLDDFASAGPAFMGIGIDMDPDEDCADAAGVPSNAMESNATLDFMGSSFEKE